MDPRKQIPQHVFISFSSHDRPFAENLARDLSEQGISIWIDYKKLEPGTPDWEAAIRDAIATSLAVVIVASPNAVQSQFVKGELSLANAHDCPVYPVWFKGDHWVDCIPIAMSATQYIDLRNGHYNTGLSQILDVLKGLIKTTMPKHCLLEDFMCASGGELSRTPSGFATIAVSNNAEKEFTVAFQPSAFPNIESVLDEVFINYLSTRFDPFTYGLEWVLVEDGRHCNRIIGPWEFVCDLFKIPLMSISKWALSTSPDECGFAPGTRWRVCSNLSDFGRNYLVGLALNELRVLMATDRHPKALGAFLRDDVLAVRPFDTVEIENYKLLQPAVIDISYLRHSQSVKFHEDVLRAGARGACLVQTDTPIDGDWLNHYQERY